MTSTNPTSRRDGLSTFSVGLAAMALLTAMVAVGFGVRAIDENGTQVDAGANSSTAPATASVDLTEFKITDASVAVGGSLHVTNAGSTGHNMVIDGSEVVTGDLASGASEHLVLDGVAAGTYTMFCSIPGHREAGMQAKLTVAGTAAAATGETAAPSHDGMDYQAMTAAMLETMGQFPAATQGVGNTVLEPTEVTADGTKVFDLTAKITKWERAPGDVVDAWTYNGMVPAPSIHLQVGDRAQFRLHNELPLATDLHLHGLNVDNKYDGIAPLTQPLIEPGASFTYEYTADEVSVAMYHPHFHSQVGLPNGMFGTIFVGQVPIPRGRTIGGEVIPADLQIAQDFPMVLNDAGVIGYSLNGKSFPATAPIVAGAGQWVLFHYFNEGTQIHPMHLHQFDQIVIAKDGFTLDQPYVVDTLNVAPGERYSVLVNLDKAGTWVWHCHILPHVEGEDGMFGMVTAIVVQ
ncbi:MAG: hypothetical protein QOG82_146 [Actinomycetota bacterium]|jgi:uncharacterized cupredoxin-like copper-binding protein|nr:hypothetical protein [Actinomycetota bacterium]